MSRLVRGQVHSNIIAVRECAEPKEKERKKKGLNKYEHKEHGILGLRKFSMNFKE